MVRISGFQPEGPGSILYMASTYGENPGGRIFYYIFMCNFLIKILEIKTLLFKVNYSYRFPKIFHFDNSAYKISVLAGVPEPKIKKTNFFF